MGLFNRLARLYGEPAVARLSEASVVVFGLGGVGSFAAEALGRSALGYLRLVDYDEVSASNTNRQLLAMASTMTKPKAEVLAARLRDVNPAARIEARRVRYGVPGSEALLRTPAGERFDFVVDCIDNITAKAHLIARCLREGTQVVTSAGAGGKRDPTRVRIVDLNRTDGCPMAKELRKTLRRHHGFPTKETFGVPAVFSDESRQWPRELPGDLEDFGCDCLKRGDRHDCNRRKLIDGTAGFVTGAFGLAVASVVVNHLVAEIGLRGRPAADRYGQRPA